MPDLTPSAQQYEFLQSEKRYRAFVGGIGTGKSMVAMLAALQACDVAQRGMLVAPSYTMVEDILVPEIEPLAHEAWGIESFKYSPPPKLKLANGSEILFRSAENPEKLRGPNLGFVGIDEAAQVPKDVWDVLIGRVRKPPEKAWVTTTPAGYNWIYDRFVDTEDDNVFVVRARTEDAPWLSEEYIESLYADYSEQMRRQEMEGEFVAQEGTAWSWEDIQREDAPDELDRVVVGVDPAGGGQDEIGIVCCGRSGERGYVLEDASLKGRPNTWARRAVQCFRDHEADSVVVETNYGGEMVGSTLWSVDPDIPIDEVQAKRGKRLRADPVIARYEQGKAFHAGNFPELEKQMTTWDPETSKSPDRVDALVYAMKELLIGRRRGPTFDATTTEALFG